MTPYNLGQITVGVIRLSKLAGAGVFAVAIVAMSPTATLAHPVFHPASSRARLLLTAWRPLSLAA
jgi:hypothetical protein